MTDAELKPCPFCGKENQTWASVLDGRTLGCSKCGARFTQFNGPPDNTAEDRLIALWNTRAPSPAAVTVKPLPWRESYGVTRADTDIGTWYLKGKIAEFSKQPFSMVVGDDPKADVQAKHEKMLSGLVNVTPAPVAGWRDMDSAPDWEGFGRAMVEDWPTGDIEGSFLFDMALKYGLIKEIPGGYDPDQHEDVYGISPEDGDPWYEYSFGSEPAPGQPATEGPDVSVSVPKPDPRICFVDCGKQAPECHCRAQQEYLSRVKPDTVQDAARVLLKTLPDNPLDWTEAKVAAVKAFLKHHSYPVVQPVALMAAVKAALRALEGGES